MIIVVYYDLNKVLCYFDDFVILNYGIVDYGFVDVVYIFVNIEWMFSVDFLVVLFMKEEM